MTDPDGTKVASYTGNVRDMNTSSYSGATSWHLYAQMKVEEGQTIQNGVQYALTVDYVGEKTLVDGAGAVKRSTSAPQASLVDFLILDPQITNVGENNAWSWMTVTIPSALYPHLTLDYSDEWIVDDEVETTTVDGVDMTVVTLYYPELLAPEEVTPPQTEPTSEAKPKKPSSKKLYSSAKPPADF